MWKKDDSETKKKARGYGQVKDVNESRDVGKVGTSQATIIFGRQNQPLVSNEVVGETTKRFWLSGWEDGAITKKRQGPQEQEQVWGKEVTINPVWGTRGNIQV